MTTDAPATEPQAPSTALTYHGGPLPVSEAARKRFDQDSIDLLTASVVPTGTDRGTLYRFVEIAARYDLDPYRNEIWCANMSGRDGGGGRIAILVGRDGYLKCARREEDFVDVDADVIYSKDEYRVVRKADGTRTVEHSYGNPADRGEAVAAYAILRREGKPDRYFLAPLDQYGKNPDKSAWKYRDAMLVKCAQSYILRTTYGVNGAVPADEINAGIELPPDSQDMAVAAAAAPTLKLPDEIASLFDRAASLDPASWRRNEIEARIFTQEGDADPGLVRKLKGELEEWLAANEPTDAVVVEGDEGEKGPQEPQESAQDDDADVVDAEPVAESDAPEEPEALRKARQELAKVQAELSRVAEGTPEADKLWTHHDELVVRIGSLTGPTFPANES
jgi:hypothetical protein